MKVAPLYHALKHDSDLDTRIVHTGQHYDANMSDRFFTDLELPTPHEHLEVGSGSHAEQTARVMIAYEQVCLRARPDLTVVVGDVNSTVACALTAVKLGIPTAHLEAGLRSFDRSMPEEINRIVVDAISDILWTPSRDGDINLRLEGVNPKKVRFVGNIMIDSLELIRPKLDPAGACARFGVQAGGFGLATFHRPSNVDDEQKRYELVDTLKGIASLAPVICPLHPRTRLRLREAGLLEKLDAAKNVHLTEPLPYRDFIALLIKARYVATDSGGIQEESTYLGIPCFTVRENTERPVTILEGTNQLVGFADVVKCVANVMSEDRPPARRIPELWDGKTAARVRASLREVLFPVVPVAERVAV
jgi:UDP-N-acetylglucosamine 2-epimerase (non-hydrolysing)